MLQMDQTRDALDHYREAIKVVAEYHRTVADAHLLLDQSDDSLASYEASQRLLGQTLAQHVAARETLASLAMRLWKVTDQLRGQQATQTHAAISDREVKRDD